MNKVLAKVNGKEITQADLETLLGGLQPQVAAQFYSPEGQQKLLEELINQELLYTDALERKLDEKSEFVEEMARVKESVLKQYALKEILDGVSVSDEEIENFYNEKKDMYKKPEMVRASHILVDNEEKAKELLAQIKEGASFETLAQENSLCPSKEVAGDLGEFARGSMVPEFEDAAFAMDVNEISAPIKTQFGYHLIKVTDKKEAGQSSLEEVKETIRQQLLAMKQQEAYMGKLKSLREKANVELEK